MKITRKTEALAIDGLTVLIYGDPGAGKTTLAASAGNTLLLDFGRGAHRASLRCDTASIMSWSDLDGVKAAYGDYDVIAVDTVGAALDMASAEIPARDGKKMLKDQAGILTLQGYGRLKAVFSGFMVELRASGKPLVMLAHAREKSVGDDGGKQLRPAITGGTYDDVLQAADFVGYLAASARKSGQSTLDFTPGGAVDKVGKNPGGIKEIVIPNCAAEPEFGAALLGMMREALRGLSARQSDAVGIIARFRELVTQASDEDLPGLLEQARAMENVLGLQAFAILKDRAMSLGFVYDQATRIFVPAEAA